MGNTCSRCLGKRGEKKYRKPQQADGGEEDITVATSQGSDIKRDNADFDRTKSTSNGSASAKSPDAKKPAASSSSSQHKKKKRQSSDSSDDTSNSSDSSSDSEDGYHQTTRKVYTNRHGGTTVVSKQVNIRGTSTKISGGNNMVINIDNRWNSGGSQPRQGVVTQQGDTKPPQEVKTRFVPYNDKTKGDFFGRSKTSEEHGNFVYSPATSDIRLEGGDVPQLKVDALKSVCRIQYPTEDGVGHGTGFRIGRPELNLILTAGHVLKAIMVYEDRSIFDEQDIDAVRNLRRGDVWCIFNHTIDDHSFEEKDKFYFKPVIHFYDRETDTAILELKENDLGTPMPPSFTIFALPEPTKPFYLMGHPMGGRKMSFQSEYIINMTDPDTSNHIDIVRGWCSERNMNCEVSEFHRLNNPARWLFHVADAFTKGASGSPGVVFHPPYGISVVTVLLRGYPDWFYDKTVTLQQKAALPTGYRVEQGANMHCVFRNLRMQNESLYNQICRPGRGAGTAPM